MQGEGEWQGEGSLPWCCVRVADVQCEGEWQEAEGFCWQTCLQPMHCSNYRVEIGAVGIKNLEDLANRKLLSDCQNTSTLIIPNRKLLYN